MPDKYHVLRSIVITLLLSSITVGVTSSSAKHAPADQTLESIQDCIARSPTPWPDEWKQEYIGTVRSAVELHRDASHYAARLEILGKGFAPYWEGFKKTPERSLFEVHRARIRWYTEHLMGAKLPSGNERQKLHDQYKDIWDHAAYSLLKQFPFLDPNAVQDAKADDLSECYRKIEAPLMPVYLKPMSEEQVEQIKQRWEKLRYIRVDLWRRLSGNSKTRVENRDAPSSNAERDYELTQKSLSQLLGQIWMVASQRPDYYLNVIEKRTEALKHHVMVKRQARNNQQRLEKGRSRQLQQTEHISFMLAALLETMSYNDGLDSIRPLEQSLLKQQGRAAKGGGAYEVNNVSKEN